MTTLTEAVATVAGRGRPFLVTTASGGGPHVGVVDAALDGSAVVVRGAGPRSRANLAANHAVTLLWPAVGEEERNLILDGTARVDGDVVVVSPTKAILHRPTLDEQGIPAGNDCLNVDLGD